MPDSNFLNVAVNKWKIHCLKDKHQSELFWNVLELQSPKEIFTSSVTINNKTIFHNSKNML